MDLSIPNEGIPFDGLVLRLPDDRPLRVEIPERAAAENLPRLDVVDDERHEPSARNKRRQLREEMGKIGACKPIRFGEGRRYPLQVSRRRRSGTGFTRMPGAAVPETECMRRERACPASVASSPTSRPATGRQNVCSSERDSPARASAARCQRPAARGVQILNQVRREGR